MKVLVLGLLSLIATSAFAYDYAPGNITLISDRHGNQYYQCNMRNNDPIPALIHEIRFYYVCDSRRGPVPTTSTYNCDRNCVIRGYETQHYIGPEVCRRGTLQVECGVFYSR
jgi:hypothetical protein